jgi:hypothetical protein
MLEVRLARRGGVGRCSAVCLVACLALCACSDDGTRPPDPPAPPFEVVLAVSHADGKPAAGIAIGAMPAVHGWLEFPTRKDGQRVAVTIPVAVAEPGAEVCIEIRDVAGDFVRAIFAGSMAAGIHHAIWDGTDDNGAVTPPGYYEVVLLFSPGADGHYEPAGTAGILQATFDPGVYSYGVTDVAGELVIGDRRLVPAFYGPLPLHLRDEQGADLGIYELTPEIWFHLVAPGGKGQWAVLGAVDSAQDLTITLAGAGAPSGARGTAVRGDPMSRRLADPPLALGHPYPNPFN